MSLFVTFEGVEGAGKSTQIRLLAEGLRRDGHTVCVTREPGGDAFAESIRHLLLHETMTPRAELLLFLASRAQNVEQVIRPQLAAGAIVLCDRYTDSSLAYQGYARGLGSDVVDTLNAFAINGVTPDLTFLLDLDPAIGLARQQDANRMEAESLAFHQKVREGFLQAAQKFPARFRIIEATLPVETLHHQISAELHRALPYPRPPL